MWLSDIANAIAILRERGYHTTLVKKIVPCENAIGFYTTYETLMVVYRNGLILEYEVENM
jgi:hypothetical protein